MVSEGTLFFRKSIVHKSTRLSQNVTVIGSKNSGSETLQSSHPHQDETDLRGKNVVRNSLLAGSVSGMASTLVLYPMDLIRTSMQAGSMSSIKSQGGPLQVLRQIVQVGGIRALYTGIYLPLVAQAAYKGTIFTVNNSIEQAILDYKSRHNPHGENVQLTLANRVCCGFVAGAVNAGIFVTPVEFVRNQLIAQQAKLTTTTGSSPPGAMGTTWSVIRDSIQTGGIHSLWRGVGITVVRDGIGVACFFSAVATTQQFLIHTFVHENDKHQQPPFWIRLVSGASAGLAYWVSTLPLDTIKTWIQSSDSSVRVSPLKEISAIYADQGVLGVVSRLNRGWQVAYGRGAPAAAVTIGVYSTVYHLLQQHDEKSYEAP